MALAVRFRHLHRFAARAGANVGLTRTALLVAAVLAGLQATPARAQAKATIKLDTETGLLSGSVEKGAAIADVVARICKLSGIRVQVRGDPGKLKDGISLDGLDVEAALVKATAGRSIVMTYARPDPATAQAPTAQAPAAPPRVVAVRLIAEGEDVVTPPAGRVNDEHASRNAVEPAADPRFDRVEAQREIVVLSQEGGPEAAGRLAEIATGSDDAAARRSAVGALADMGGEESFDALVAALQDDDARVRIGAARGLMRADEERARPLVEIAADRESDKSTRDALEKLVRRDGDGRDGDGRDGGGRDGGADSEGDGNRRSPL